MTVGMPAAIIKEMPPYAVAAGRFSPGYSSALWDGVIAALLEANW